LHLKLESAIYLVCLIARNQYASDTICKQVEVGISSTYTLPILPQAQVYPNPATDELMVRLPVLLPSHELHFALTDALRRTVREEVLADFETKVNLKGIPKGMYFWRLSIKGETLQTGKVIKM